MPPIRRLRRAELPIDTVQLARFLIGKTLVHDLPSARAEDGRPLRLSGRIVETEAYPVGDSAGHAFRGHTRANHSLFLKRGHAYVHFTYGSCWLFNVTSEVPGVGAGVLLRAIEPVEGVELMAHHRGISRLLDLTRGPGRLTAALKITKAFDAVDLCSGPRLWLGTPVQTVGEIGMTTRIGISREAHRLLRFYERGNPFVSGPRRLCP